MTAVNSPRRTSKVASCQTALSRNPTSTWLAWIAVESSEWDGARTDFALTFRYWPSVFAFSAFVKASNSPPIHS